MLIDGRATAPEPGPYDLIIIGAGPAGISLAVEMEGSGLRIALVEGGGEGFDPDVQALYDGPVTGNEAELDLAAIRLRALGGTSLHWGGRCTPMDRIDFERAPDGLSGWPFPYDELLPYYLRAHAYCDLGAFDYSLSAPTGISAEALLLTDRPEVETKILRQSPPTRFGEKYLDLLRDSTTTDLWLWTNATHVAVTADGALDTVETRTLGGPDRVFRTRSAVLACGAVENARLLLASNARDGQSFGAAGDLLGRCYMDHPTGGAAFLHFDRPQAQKAYWARSDTHATEDVPFHFVMRPSDAVLRAEALPNVQFYIYPLATDPETRARQKAATQTVRSLKTIAKYTLGRDVPETVSLSDEYCAFITNADSFVADTAHRWIQGDGVPAAILKYEQEEPPKRTNRVTLAETRDALDQPRAAVHWAPGADEIEAVQRSATQIGIAAGAAGLGRVELEDNEGPFWNMTTSWHQMGTTRMAQSPTSGVTDPMGRVQGTQALFMAGGSLFPTVGRANPTLTVVALALRLADHLKAEMPRL